jgi:hypothetical protein
MTDWHIGNGMQWHRLFVHVAVLPVRPPQLCHGIHVNHHRPILGDESRDGLLRGTRTDVPSDVDGRRLRGPPALAVGAAAARVRVGFLRVDAVLGDPLGGFVGKATIAAVVVVALVAGNLQQRERERAYPDTTDASAVSGARLKAWPWMLGMARGGRRVAGGGRLS